MGEEHSFWCMKCGQKGIPLFRPRSLQRGKFHRKKLYCPHCRVTVNHVECRSDWEVAEFKTLFSDGFFQEEAEMSVKECAENG